MITFCKLKDGTWGLKLDAASFNVKEGARVQVHRKDGSIVKATVGAEVDKSPLQAYQVYRLTKAVDIERRPRDY